MCMTLPTAHHHCLCPLQEIFLSSGPPLTSQQTEITASVSPLPNTGLLPILGYLCYFALYGGGGGLFLDYSPISTPEPKLQPKHLQVFCLLQSLEQRWGLGRHSVPMKWDHRCAIPEPTCQTCLKLVKPYTGPLAGRDVCMTSGLYSSSVYSSTFCFCT